MIRLLQHSCLVLSLLLLIGCMPPKQKMIGEWVVDFNEIERSESFMKIGDPVHQLASQWQKSMMGSWYFRFNSDRSLELKYRGVSYKGRYEVKQVAGTKIYLRAHLQTISGNELDQLMGFEPDTDKVIEERFSLDFTDGKTVLRLDDTPPLLLKRLNQLG